MTAETATPEAIRIVGGVGTGKTERLVGHVAALVANGTAPKDVLVFCASPHAARAFALRLRTKMGDVADQVRVITPRAFALEVLADEDARTFTGREPRLLADFEEKFLLEDMKVCGLRPRRLREMIKFFYRSWTELADDDASWLLPGEETEVHTLLKANLAFTRAVVEPEAANLAVHYLREHEAARDAHAATHVVADDWQCLSRASQRLVELAATTSIAIAGDPAAVTETFDSHPYAAGLDEFAERYPQAELVELDACVRSRATAQAASRVLADPAIAGAPLASDPASDEGALDVMAADDPTEEFARIATLVADELAAGTPVQAVTVAVPNGTWARNIVAALAEHGVAAETLADMQAIRGDIRDNTRCVAARVMTALDLVANPRDAVAWRCWCGFGDYLVNSAAFSNLRAYADGAGIGLVEALEQVAGGADASGEGDTSDVVGATRVADAYQTGLALIERAQDLTGRELLDELARAVTGDDAATAPAAIAALCLDGADGDDLSATTLVRRARERLFFPTLRNEQAVAVVPYDSMVGLAPEVLVVAGFVNGFIPCRDFFDGTVTPLDKQKKMHTTDTHRVYTLVGKAGRRLVLSYFTSADLEPAAVLKLKIDRIKLKNGVRTCVISPSDFLSTITEA